MRRGFPGRLTTGLRRGLLLGALGLGAAGCANVNVWDDITSKDFKFRNLYHPPDPMTTLRESTDGDARAKAMKALKEPAHHGHPADQDDAVAILSQAAVTDSRPLCRLAAINALGRFEDPRTAMPLVQAYHAAGDKAFTPDIANTIRCQALQELGNKKSPEATALLVQVLTLPATHPVDPTGTQLTSFGEKKPNPFESEDPAARNAKLTAIRALGQSGSMQATATLIPMLADKDVAVRDRVQEALQRITGRKDVAPEPQAWQAALSASAPK
jgi:HEAT repeat protein